MEASGSFSLAASHVADGVKTADYISDRDINIEKSFFIIISILIMDILICIKDK